ncbi:MAG: hypothetical protein JXR05_15480 [Flavobacteriaceae bacterium]
MIKFFKKVRRQFMLEGRYRQSLLYGIGEIILIVLGILIALQIDNWNTNKSEIESLIKSFEQIEQSLVVDLANINEVIEYHTNASEASKKARKHLKERKEYTQELSDWITDADNLKIFTQQSSTFEAIKRNGIELIENIWLKDQLIRVYEKLIEDHKRRESIVEYIRNNYYNIWETKNLDREESNLYWEIRDYETVLNDYEFHGNLLTLVNRHRGIIKTAKELAVEIQSLKAHISQEIIRLKTNEKLPEWKKSIAFEDKGIMLFEGRFRLGLYFEFDSPNKQHNWVSISNDLFCMSYPGEQDWGVVFITTGRPANPPRQSEDFSKYTKLFIEMKGEVGGEKIEIAIKDRLDPPDGSEDKSAVVLTNEWKTYEFDIASNFGSANLNDVYIVTSFVFGNEAQNICVKKIYYK